MKQTITRKHLIQKGLIKPDLDAEKQASFARAVFARRREMNFKPLVSVKVTNA